MSDNLKIAVYILAMTLVVSVVLAFFSSALAPGIAKNIELDRQGLIVQSFVDDPNVDIESFYSDKIDYIVMNGKGDKVEMDPKDIDIRKEWKKPFEERNIPIYVYEGNKGKKFSVPLYGKGLWDDIWGYVSLDDDMKTINDAVFDHKAETPGLGAEINNYARFQDQFKGKQLFDEDNEYVFEVLKGEGNQLSVHTVDGISGATVTARGVDKMFKNDISNLANFFQKIK